jgi:acetyl-CoA acyltransferase
MRKSRYAVNDVVIVGAVRTPIGKRGGGLSGIHPADLSSRVLRALEERVGFAPADVDDVIWGCVTQASEQSFNVGRTAVLSAGWPESVPATTVDRQCGSSQQALHFAVAGVAVGHYDLAIAGGVESMSRVPMGSSAEGGSPWGADYLARYGAVPPAQGISGEMVAEHWSLSREDLDRFALRSHELAAAAQDAGVFDQEIVEVKVEEGRTVHSDEGIRRGGTLDQLAALKSAFIEDGRLHAGNSSQVSDGAAAVAVTSAKFARRHGLEPLVRIRSVALAGDSPTLMLTAPIPATKAALRRAKLRPSAVGAYEVNEAFAPVPLAWLNEVDVDPMTLNPNGGAIALGHPLGASGARIATTLVHHMRRNGIQFGLQTMCEHGGLANATVFELA